MQRVVDLKSPPVVGQYYLVPCVSIVVNARRYDVPIYGGWHGDPEINNPKPHFHVDFRFISDRLGGVLTRKPLDDSFFLSTIQIVRPWSTTIYEKPRRCWREQHLHHDGIRTLGGDFIELLVDLYKDSKVIVHDGCKLCPHKRMPLDSMRCDSDGVVECMGHGLRWKPDGTMANTGNAYHEGLL